jgi:murein DD-endopeptidase MepM/ murein hydrolase activator NlpD
VTGAGVEVVAARILSLGLAMLASACATYGIDHVVRPGENLYRIGKAYGVGYDELARINRIRPPYRLEIGDQIYVPDADRQLPVTIITPRAVSSEPPPRAVVHAPHVSVTQPVYSRDGRVGPSGFSWPLSGRLSSSFGKRARGHHDGIDIAASKGAPVYASRDGRVIFSDRLSGYGNVIIVEHVGGFATVYAHNDANFVRKGARVRRGERIAAVGDTGRTRGPHLHFEIRRQNVARNPMYYLPSSRAASVAAAR